jgi:hypothetical protein
MWPPVIWLLFDVVWVDFGGCCCCCCWLFAGAGSLTSTKRYVVTDDAEFAVAVLLVAKESGGVLMALVGRVDCGVGGGGMIADVLFGELLFDEETPNFLSSLDARLEWLLFAATLLAVCECSNCSLLNRKKKHDKFLKKMLACRTNRKVKLTHWKYH